MNHDEFVARLEHEFAAFQHCAYGVSAVNGTVTLEMALEAELGADLPLGFFLGEEISLKYLSERLREQLQSFVGGESQPEDDPPIASIVNGSAALDAEPVAAS